MNHIETNEELRKLFPNLDKFMKKLGFDEEPSEGDPRWAYKFYLYQPEHYFEARFFLGRPMEHGGINLVASVSYLGEYFLNIDNKGSLGLHDVKENVLEALRRMVEIFKAIKYQKDVEPNVGTRLANIKENL